MNKLFRFYSMFIKWYSVVILQLLNVYYKWYSMNSIKKIWGIRMNSNPNFTRILLVILYEKHIFPINISLYARITLNRAEYCENLGYSMIFFFIEYHLINIYNKHLEITTEYHLINIEQNLNNLFIGIPSYSIVFKGRGVTPLLQLSLIHI